MRKSSASHVCPALASLIPGVALVGCKAAPAPIRSGASLVQAATYVYTCPDGYRFSARARGDSVTLRLPTRILTLPKVETASGTRYEGHGTTYAGKGEDASLETDATLHSQCQAARAANAWEEAALLGVEFRAVGQEPGWTLELDEGRSMRFIGNYGNEVVVTPAPAPGRDSTLGTTWTARTEAHTLTLIAREAACRDAMSGEAFSHTVTVRVDGTERRGCGRPLRTGEARNSYWKLIEVDGAAAIAPTTQREPHLRFDVEGREVTGSTGCNTVRGPVTLDRQRIHVGPVVSTRVACPDTALTRQERAYLGAIEGADHFTVADGHLTLYGNDRLLARFEVVYFR